MKYIKQKNKITIKTLSSFNIKHILECGQVFRFKKIDNFYEVISGNELAKIYSYNNKIEIFCTNEDYFENYFDLKTNYENIKKELIKYDVLKNPIEYGYGIRILRQQKLETIISFIVSANNNIKRISTSINKMCFEYGTYINKLDGFYAFPTLTQLSQITIEQFEKLGMGYRAKYLFETIKNLKEMDFESIEFEKTSVALKKLIGLKGVGAKVADCIMLFGYYNTFVFPVDVWIEKVYNSFFNPQKLVKNRVLIRKELVEMFGNASGYAQQYLFYYKREKADI